jgi:hypothetical protein
MGSRKEIRIFLIDIWLVSSQIKSGVLKEMKIEQHPSTRQLKVFGLLWFLVFGVSGILAWLKAGITIKAILLGITAFLIPGLGFLWTGFLREVYIIASYATYPIGTAVSYIMLAVIYYGVITPVGLALRLAGCDLLKRRLDSSARTYWVDRRPERDTKRYFQQF